MHVPDLQFWLLLLQIMAVNLILSGDNAVVIALACRDLPPQQQTWGIFLGAGIAVGLLLVFTFFVAYLLGIPYLRLGFGAALFWIAYRLMLPSEEVGHVEAATSLMHAIRAIVIADVVMSFDNIVAVAGVANGNFVLMALGLAISIPMVMYGASLLVTLLKRFPAIVPGAAALIGFVGGEIMLEDPAWAAWVAGHAPWMPEAIPLICATAVVLAGRMATRSLPQRAAAGLMAKEAAEAAAVVGVRAVGEFVLARAPAIVSFAASALGYGESIATEGSAGDLAGPALAAVRPIFGAVIAVVIAEILPRLGRLLGIG